MFTDALIAVVTAPPSAVPATTVTSTTRLSRSAYSTVAVASSSCQNDLNVAASRIVQIYDRFARPRGRRSGGNGHRKLVKLPGMALTIGCWLGTLKADSLEKMLQGMRLRCILCLHPVLSGIAIAFGASE